MKSGDRIYFEEPFQKWPFQEFCHVNKMLKWWKGIPIYKVYFLKEMFGELETCKWKPCINLT